MSKLPSNDEWIYWGQHDSLFAVASRPGKEVNGQTPWTAQEFLEMGRRYFADVYRQWQRYGVGADHCVEIGCGAGRITRQLAGCFGRVTALDVSQGQLETARQLLGPAASNVAFTLVTEPMIPLPDASCDGVFSCEVFQHLDPPSTLGVYLREAHRVLTPGGTVCFQLPVRGVQPSSVLSSDLRNSLLGLLRRFGRRRMMIYRQFNANDVFQMLEEAGFKDIEMKAFHAAEQDGYHCYFFGRKT